MIKHPFTESFLKPSLNKALAPYTSTATTLSPAIALRPLMAELSSSTLTQSHSSSSPWRSTTMARLILLLLSALFILPKPIETAPAKHVAAPKNLVNAMEFSVSDSSALPLQLQIEARVAGIQKLAYLPTSGPSLDFYYLNYRPSYRAGESTIDFWMLTPQGSKAPKTGSLELFDEFGRIRLAVLVPEGTEVPQTIANKHESFLWKSWVVPKTLKANFDFSEKFRVVLQTSDTNNNMKKKVDKRLDMDDSTMLDFLLVKSKNKHVNAADNANTISSSALTDHSTIVQDRQFRIKGLKATPGGNPNPAKMNVHNVAVAATPTSNTFIPPNVHTIQNDSHISFNPIKPSETGLDNASGAPSSAPSSRVALSRMTAFVAIFIAALVALY